MKNIVLKCDNLYKKYGKNEVLNNISFEVREGDIIGLIGKNGAGKTTLIKMLLNLQKKDRGNVIINGYDIDKHFESAIKKVGAIIETPDFYNYLTGIKNLYLYKNLYKDITDDRINELVKLVGLDDAINKKVSKYSLGMKQRLGIAVSLMHNPNLLILDEPTNGLDPKGVSELRNLLVKLSKQKISIIVSSHNLNEIEMISNKVYILNDGTLEMLEKKHKQYIIEVDNSSKIKNILNNKISILDSNTFKIDVDRKNVPYVIKKLINNNVNVYKVDEEVNSLENIFLNRVGV